jgi:hypothetical protein
VWAQAAAEEAVCGVIAEAKEVATVRHAVPGSWCSACDTVMLGYSAVHGN